MRAPILLAALLLIAPAAAAQDAANRLPATPTTPTAEALGDAPAGAPRAVERRGALTFYFDREAFETANPGLPLEDFEDINATTAPMCVSYSPVHAGTQDNCYDRGTLMAPIQLAAVGPTQSSFEALIALPAGYQIQGTPLTSTAVGANLGVDSTEVRFSPPVRAAGMDVYQFFWKSLITVRVYDPDGNVLGTTEFWDAVGGRFFGVESDGAPIGAIRFAEHDDYAFIDNLSFATIGGDVSFSPEVLAPVIESGATGFATVTVYNTSSGDVQVALPLSLAPTFITAIAPAGATIPAGGSIQVKIEFDATDLFAGTYTGTLVAETDLAADIDTFILPVELHVTGTAACTITPEDLTFPETIVGTSSVITATVSNTGTDACHLAAASGDGPFAVVDFAETAVPPTASTAVTVHFTPTAAGPASGTLTIETSDGPLTASLSGIGKDAPTPAVAPDALTIEVEVDETATAAISISNEGGTDAADLEFSVYVARLGSETASRAAAPAPPDRASFLAFARGNQALTRGAETPLARPRTTYRGETVMITHSVSQTINAGDGLDCPDAPTSWWRVFDLADFGIDTQFAITSVDIGVEAAVSTTTTLSLYALDGELATANLTPIGSTQVAVGPDDALSLVNVPIRGTLAATDVLAVRWSAPAGGVVFGGNQSGQSGPTYIQAAACGAPEPVDLSWIGFNYHWVLNVHGYSGPALLTVSPEDGVIAPGASTTVDLLADASGFEPGTYLFEVLIATNDPNNPEVAVDVTVVVTPPVAGEDGATPITFALEPLYPNPLSAATTIRYTLPEAGPVTLDVFDAAGRRVARLADGHQPAGRHSVAWTPAGLASGAYVVRLQAGRQVQSRKLTILH